MLQAIKNKIETTITKSQLLKTTTTQQDNIITITSYKRLCKLIFDNTDLTIDYHIGVQKGNLTGNPVILLDTDYHKIRYDLNNPNTINMILADIIKFLSRG